MKSPLSIALLVTGSLGAGALAASAFAQTPGPASGQAAPTPTTSSQAAPSQANSSQATSTQTNPPAQSADQESQHGNMQGGRMSERTSRSSSEDRAAFFDARVAAVHAGLHLTPDQEKLWPALENAARDAMRTMADLREKSRSAGAPSNLVERMQRKSDRLIARGQALKKIADAAQPLFATLSDEQKERLPMLMRGGHHGWRERAGMNARQRDSDRSGERDRLGANGDEQDRYRGSDEDEDRSARDDGWRQDRRNGFDEGRDFDRRDQGHESGWRHGRGRGFDGDRDYDRRDRGYSSGWQHGRRGGWEDDRDFYRGPDRESYRDSYRDSDRGGRGWDRD